MFSEKRKISKGNAVDVFLKSRWVITYLFKAVSLLVKEQFYCFLWMEGEGQWTQIDSLELVGTAE